MAVKNLGGGRLYAKSICSFFSLCMEFNVLEKSANSRVASRFFARTPSMIRWMIKIWGCEAIPLKGVLIFSKNFLDFESDIPKKQGIINSSSYISKSYASVALRDSMVDFPEGGKDATFCPYLSWLLWIHSVRIACRQILLSSKHQELFRCGLHLFWF